MDEVPPHFHKTDRISEKDIIPDGDTIAVVPDYPAPEGTEVSYLSGTTFRRYKMISGTWRQIGTDPIPAPAHMLIHAHNAAYDTYFYTFAFGNDWKRVIFPNGSGAQTIEIFKNPGGDKQGTFIKTGATVITPGAAGLVHSCYEPLTDKFLIADDAGTTLYKYNNDDTVSGEASITVSGTTLTSIKGLAADGTNVFIFDGGTSTVKKFTFAGSTLTYVSSVTLGDSSAKQYLAADANYLYSYESGNTKYWAFDKSAGTTISSFPTSVDANARQRGLSIDPDGKLRALVAYSHPTAASALFFYLTRLSLT